ncbi:hypothetical protein SORBI_3005G030233 [Sorghum bicolor]|uniref:Uncharacterized protein n=1 Tax=Sorghum bicolor TaxID=4558 RepID=A0A1Z5RGF3_SORBI|nr:hypothetical protein SORBI_3005G030233 [Sorghum bicolor]
MTFSGERSIIGGDTFVWVSSGSARGSSSAAVEETSPELLLPSPSSSISLELAARLHRRQADKKLGSYRAAGEDERAGRVVVTGTMRGRGRPANSIPSPAGSAMGVLCTLGNRDRTIGEGFRASGGGSPSWLLLFDTTSSPIPHPLFLFTHSTCILSF